MDVVMVNAGEIISVLFYPKSMLNNRPPNSFLAKKIENGNMIHKRLGYSQPNVYSRFYEMKDVGRWLLIKGAPDRIKLPYIEELKTYNPKKGAKEKRLQVAGIQLQIYSFLTGIPSQKIILYNTETQKIDFEVTRKYNPDLFKLSLKTFWEITQKIKKMEKNINVDFTQLINNLEPPE